MLNFTCILAKMYVTHLINLEGGGVSAPLEPTLHLGVKNCKLCLSNFLPMTKR